MKNFTMRPSAGILARYWIILCACLLVGCSAARLGYSNGETLSYFWLNNYAEFEHDQKSQVRRQLDTLFAWHRNTQLQRYVPYLKNIQKRVEAGAPVTEEELQKDYETLMGFAEVVLERALPEATDLAISLQAHQLANIQKKFASNNDTYRKEYLRGDVEQRQRFRFKRALKQTEHWFGNLSPDQEKALRALSDARPLDNELVLADRLRRQATLLALLKKIQTEKPERNTARAWLKDYAHTVMESSGDAKYKAHVEASRLGSMRMTAWMFNHATPAQKAHLQRALQGWIDDFSKLSGS